MCEEACCLLYVLHYLYDGETERPVLDRLAEHSRDAKKMDVDTIGPALQT